MTDAAEKSQRHYVAVYFKGHESAAWVPMESRIQAMATVAFLAGAYLRKHPSDRSGVWCPTVANPRTIVNDGGVEQKTDLSFLGAFDPRDIAAVQIVTREVDPWEGSE